MTNILPISRIPTIPKPAAVPSLWNNIYDEIDDRLKKLNDGKQEAGSGMDGFAPINSPAFTGSPTAPTPSTSDSDTSVATTAFVQAAIASAMSIMPIVPTGTVIHVAMSTAPPGFLKADGSTVSRSVYAALFSVIGVTFGIGDAVSTFSLPDLRGEFVRGWDDGRGIDPSRGFGSVQSGTRHGYAFGANGIGAIGAFWSDSLVNFDAANKEEPALTPNPDNGGPVYPAGTMYQNIKGSVEIFNYKSRPRNVALLACIKY